jgi:hypothetical protein
LPEVAVDSDSNVPQGADISGGTCDRCFWYCYLSEVENVSDFFMYYRLLMPLAAASVVYWSEFLTTDPKVQVRFPELPDFLRSSGPGTGSSQPHKYN